MTTQPQPPETPSTVFLHVGIPDGAETPHAGTPGSGGDQLGLFDGSATLTAGGSAENAEVGTPDAAGLLWLAFTGDHDQDAARQRFEAKYGRPPARVFLGLGGILLCGPVPSGVLL